MLHRIFCQTAINAVWAFLSSMAEFYRCRYLMTYPTSVVKLLQETRRVM
jgi:hypothetical protein